MTDRDQRRHEWEARYRRGKTGWDRGQRSPAFAHWLDGGKIPQGRVLVPGCGHGYEVAGLIRAGRRVTAVDIAAQPVLRLTGELSELGLHADIVQADLLNWQPAEPFDAVYEQTCICALEPSTWSDYEQRLAGWLRPGGVLLALFMQTGSAGGPPFDCPLVQMRELFDERRWAWSDDAPEYVSHPTGLHELGFVLTRR